MLQADRLYKRYGQTVAVADLSFRVMPGEVFVLLGSNGAGKSTTVRMLSGMARPDAGRALVAGHDINLEPMKAKAALGYVPEVVTLYDRLTLKEFLSFTGSLHGINGTELRSRVLEQVRHVELEEVMDHEIGTFSKGMVQRAALAAATLHRPRALVLDEPGSGLDPRFVRRLKNWIRELAKGSAVLVCTHVTGFAAEIGDRLGIIHKGVLLAEGTLEELLAIAGADNLEEAFIRIIGAT